LICDLIVKENFGYFDWEISMSKVSKNNKVMSRKEAVVKFVFDGAIIGMGGEMGLFTSPSYLLI